MNSNSNIRSLFHYMSIPVIFFFQVSDLMSCSCRGGFDRADGTNLGRVGVVDGGSEVDWPRRTVSMIVS
jgi:hypothetical protein